MDELKDKLGEKWDNIKTKVATKMDELKEKMSDKWEAVKEKADEHVEKIKESVLEKFNKLKEGVIEVFDKIKEGIKTPINGILGFIESMINTVIDGVNSMIGKLNKVQVKMPKVLGGEKYGINIDKLGKVDIPQLANGAVLPPNQSFLAMVGDQTKGVNIEAPLETIKAGLREVLKEGSGDSGDTYVYAQFGDEAIEGVVANVVRRSKVANNGR